MSLVNRFDLLDVSDDEETTVVKKTTPAPAAPAPVAGKAAVGKPATTAATPAAKQGEKKPVGKTEGQKSEKGERKPRPEGERKPRPEGERQPRPEGERQPRPEGERRPRPEGERRPRPEGERKPRPEGERQPRPEGERKPRPEGERKPRPEGDRRPRVRKNEEGIEQPEESKQEGEAPKSDLPPRKRQFDRRGPPRKEGEKSEYHGKGNWGKPGSESTPETKEEKTEAEAAEGAEQAEKPVENAPVVEAEPEEKLITLAEFKKLKESQKKTVQATAARTANEGVDTSAWKNTEQFVRSEEAYYVPSNKPGDKKKAAPAERKAPEVIEFVPKPLIEDKFRDRRFDDKRRGKGPRSRVPEPPKLDDKSAFPSLK